MMQNNLCDLSLGRRVDFRCHGSIAPAAVDDGCKVQFSVTVDVGSIDVTRGLTILGQGEHLRC